MERSPLQRSNGAWIQALRGDGDESAAAVRELEETLRRVSSRILHGRVAAQELDDLVQESMAGVVRSLPSFRGDSAFTTWAIGIATRVVFTELRRRRVREKERDPFGDVEDEVRQLAAVDTAAPDAALSRADLLQALHLAIATRLTERQRVAVVAELRGIPTIEIAERMGTNQNALYKLVHDARKRLRTALFEAGYSAESLHDITEASR